MFSFSESFWEMSITATHFSRQKILKRYFPSWKTSHGISFLGSSRKDQVIQLLKPLPISHRIYCVLWIHGVSSKPCILRSSNLIYFIIKFKSQAHIVFLLQSVCLHFVPKYDLGHYRHHGDPLWHKCVNLSTCYKKGYT